MRLKMSATDWLDARASEMLLLTMPNTPAATPTPNAHAAMVPHDSRTASPIGEPSNLVRATAVSRLGTTAAPKSRRDANQMAAPVAATVTPTIGVQGANALPVSTFSLSIHPFGDSHVNQYAPSTDSPMARSSRPTASTAPATAEAARRVANNCDVSAPIGIKSSAPAHDAAEKNNAAVHEKYPPARPTVTTQAATDAKNTKKTTPSPPSAWPSPLARVTGPAYSRSARPSSSSPRSPFVASSRPQIAPSTKNGVELRHAVKPATVASPRGGPKMALMPTLLPSVLANWKRSSRSG